MIRKDKLKVWRPLGDDTPKPKDMWVESIFDYDGVRIILRAYNSPKRLQVIFGSPYAYAVTDESYLLKIWGENKDEEILGSSIFYIVENSSYMDFFNEMSCGLYPIWGEIIHYAIYTYDTCIDVITAFPPKVRWIDETALPPEVRWIDENKQDLSE